MANLNLSTISNNAAPASTNRFLIWEATVDETADLKYISYSQLTSAITTSVTTPVANALTGTFIANPGTKAANNLLYYNGTSWLAGTAPSGSIASTSLGASVVIAGKIAANAVVEGTIADAAVTNTKVKDGAVDNAKLASGIDAAKVTVGTLPLTTVPSIPGDRIGHTGVAPYNTTIPVNAVPSLDTSKVTTGVFDIARGGTGASTQIAALQNIKAYGPYSEAVAGRRISISSVEPASAAAGDIWIVTV